MATWIEFLKEVRDKTEVTKQDSGWVANPALPDLIVYIAYMEGEMRGALIIHEQENGYESYVLSLISATARTRKLHFSTLADAKLAHKMMTDEENRYATWEAQSLIRSLEEIKTLSNRIATITNPAPNLQNTPKLFTGDPPKDKN